MDHSPQGGSFFDSTTSTMMTRSLSSGQTCRISSVCSMFTISLIHVPVMKADIFHESSPLCSSRRRKLGRSSSALIQVELRHSTGSPAICPGGRTRAAALGRTLPRRVWSLCNEHTWTHSRNTYLVVKNRERDRASSSRQSSHLKALIFVCGLWGYILTG